MPHVFISHKKSDQDLARKIKALLESKAKRRGRNRALTVFASFEDIRSGEPWLRRIHSELCKATALILLYTDQRHNWDWCFYETGQYIGRFPSIDAVNNLFVFHPRGVPEPKPLQHWQSVQDQASVATALDAIYQTPQGSWFDGDCGARDELARKIADVLHTYDPVDVPGPFRYSLTLTAKPLTDGRRRTAAFDITVTLDERLAQKLEVANEAYPLAEFVKLRQMQETRLDAEAICKFMDNLLTEKALPGGPLPACVFDGKGYRPFVTDLKLTRGGGGFLKIGFHPTPTNLSATAANALSALGELVALTVRFRAQVVDKFALTLDPETAQLPYTAAPEPAHTQAKRLLRDIELHVSEAMAVGFDRDRVRDAFEGAPDAHARTRTLSRVWQDAFAALKHLADDPSATEEQVRATFRGLRSVNFEYLKLASAALQSLLSGIEAPPAPQQPTASAAPAAPTPPVPAPAPAAPGGPPPGHRTENSGPGAKRADEGNAGNHPPRSTKPRRQPSRGLGDAPTAQRRGQQVAAESHNANGEGNRRPPKRQQAERDVQRDTNQRPG